METTTQDVIYLPIREAVKQTNYSYATIYDAIKKEKVPSRKPEGKPVEVDIAALQVYLSSPDRKARKRKEAAPEEPEIIALPEEDSGPVPLSQLYSLSIPGKAPGKNGHDPLADIEIIITIGVQVKRKA